MRLRTFFAAGGLGALALSGVGLSVGACATETTLQSGLVVPTGVIVDPVDFLGDVVCSTRPGGMQSYVATLIDVSDPLNPFTLASSPPTSCSLSTDFRFVVADHLYLAEVDGYAEPALGLAPFGGGVSGSRHMVEAGTQTAVSPRWSGSCGVQAPAVASFDVDVAVTGCEPLVDHQGASTTGIEVDPSIALPSPATCGSDLGAVATFDVVPHGAALAPMPGVPCSTDASAPQSVVYDVGVVADTDYTFLVVARDASGAALGSSQCFATSEAGLTVLASCDPLTP